MPPNLKAYSEFRKYSASPRCLEADGGDAVALHRAHRQFHAADADAVADDRTAAERDFNMREGPFSTYREKNYGYNGSLKLSAAPFAGMRISASFVNNFTKYRGAIPDIVGNDDETYEWGKEGMDYPNWTAALTADYSIGNSLLLSYRGGWHRQNETNQQLLPPDGSTYYFAYSNNAYAKNAFYVANPDLLKVSGYSTNWNYIETKKYMTEKISNNIDATYYLDWLGEHSFKAGIGYAWLHEDVYDGSNHPRVWLYWGRTYTGLGFPVGACVPGLALPPPAPTPPMGHPPRHPRAQGSRRQGQGHRLRHRRVEAQAGDGHGSGQRPAGVAQRQPATEHTIGKAHVARPFDLTYWSLSTLRCEDNPARRQGAGLRVLPVMKRGGGPTGTLKGDAE